MADNINLPYRHFNHAQTQVANIVEIDFYLAKELTVALIKRTSIDFLIEQQHQLFHLIMALSAYLRAGHSCLPIDTLAKTLWGKKVEEDLVSHQGFLFKPLPELIALLEQCQLTPVENQPLVFEYGCLYLRRYYLFEQQVIHYFNQSKILAHIEAQQTTSQTLANYQACIDKLFDSNSNNRDVDWQKVAVANALNKQFSVIAGGPGTGKTYTVTKLLAALVWLANKQEKSLTISLVAPTGKAAQRLSESIINAVNGFKNVIETDVLDKIPTSAQTLHRLLGVIPNSPNFIHHQDNPLAIDVLLIDEVSMVDLPLMARTLRALPEHCKVILLGDAQQLPSVAAGSILADLSPLDSAVFSQENARYLQQLTGYSQLTTSKQKHYDHLVYLTQSRRFAGDGGIGTIAKQVIAGESSLSWDTLQQANTGTVSELTFFPTEQLHQVLTGAVNSYQQVIESDSLSGAFKALATFRILVATRLGQAGVDALNELISNKLLQQNVGLTRANAIYKGRPIMIGQNDYNVGLYNGDIGLFWPDNNGQLLAYFENEQGEFVGYLPSRLPRYETVYAMTIHKTQGSEFTHVALVLPDNADNQLLSRELIYTGITRAKKQLTIVANKQVWFSGVEQKVKRYSGINI